MENFILDRIKIRTKKIASISYDPDCFTLVIEFTNDNTYQYFGVPGYIFEGFMKSLQKDQYYTRYIADAGFSYEKMEY